MRTIPLAELVQQGRLSMVDEATVAGQQHKPRAANAAPRAARTAPPSPVPALAPARVPAQPPRPRATADVIDKIELLAIQLLSISKASKADPDAVMMEALRSIDRCIVSMASH